MNRKTLIFLGALALSALPVGTAMAVPMCDGGQLPGIQVTIGVGFGKMSESELADHYESLLNAQGINAHQTRFWNGCIQTFVRENGHDTMRFYDPDSLREIPVN